MSRLKDRESFSVNRAIHKGFSNFRQQTSEKRPPSTRRSMSQRLQAKSRLLFRFALSHRILFFTVIAMLVLGGVGISNSSAVKSTLSVITANASLAASTKTTSG